MADSSNQLGGKQPTGFRKNWASFQFLDEIIKPENENKTVSSVVLKQGKQGGLFSRKVSKGTGKPEPEQQFTEEELIEQLEAFVSKNYEEYGKKKLAGDLADVQGGFKKGPNKAIDGKPLMGRDVKAILKNAVFFTVESCIDKIENQCKNDY